MVNKSYEEKRAHSPITGRFLFKEDFASLGGWNAVAGSPTVSGGLLSLPTGAEVRSKRQFTCGCMFVVAKSTLAPSLQFGFDGGNVDYVVIGNGNLRLKSTVDQSEGTTAVTFTETNYNNFVIMWNLDTVIVWVNGASPVIYQGIKIPQKSLPISLKNIGTGTVYVYAVTVYPEPVAIEPFQEGNSTALSPVAMPIYIAGGTASVSSSSSSIVAYTSQRLLAAPYTDSTTNLGAGATFTGTARDLQISSSSPYPYFSGVRCGVTADQAGTLYIDESPDNSTWILGVASVAVAAGEVKRLDYKAVYRYVRVRYVNGGSAQGSFRLWSRVVGADV